MQITEPMTTTKNMMGLVVLSLVPGAITATWVFGAGVLLNLVMAIITAWTTEGLCLAMRGRSIAPRLKDHSALLTACLLALSLPQAAPWWLTMFATVSAVGLGKHLYGGLGQNPLNPAMLGYAIMLVSAPVAMTTLWVDPLNPPLLADAILAFLGSSSDAHTGATALGLYRNEFAGMTASEIATYPLFERRKLGLIAGAEWTALAYLLGGLFLIHQKIISWHIPVGFLGALILISSFFAIDPDTSTPVSVHLFAGAAVFSAFFILTDPVSGATSSKGRIWFAIGVGILTYSIRTYGQYPDAIAFSVLLMNFAAPMIDHYTRPRILGRNSAIKGAGGKSWPGA